MKRKSQQKVQETRKKAKVDEEFNYYSRISMNGEKFQLGDSVRINSEDSDNAFGIIKKIYTRSAG